MLLAAAAADQRQCGHSRTIRVHCVQAANVQQWISVCTDAQFSVNLVDGSRIVAIHSDNYKHNCMSCHLMSIFRNHLINPTTRYHSGFLRCPLSTQKTCSCAHNIISDAIRLCRSSFVFDRFSTTLLISSLRQVWDRQKGRRNF